MPERPLSDVRVLDLTHVYAGPTCARILCDLGADVIKVEGIKRTDSARLGVPADNNVDGDFWNNMGWSLFRNAGKKSVTLDFNDQRALDLFKRLVIHADVVIESYTPRVMAQHGIDYDSLRHIKPDVIMISLSGYGQTGPWREFSAYGTGLEAASGICSSTGYPAGEPLRSGISFNDPYSGMVGAGAVLVALHHKRRTGKGQYIDLSEHEAGIPVAGYAIMDHVLNGREPERIGNRSRWFAPQGCYRCRGDDHWLVLTVRDDQEWRAFCHAVGRLEWAEDERFADVLGRHRHHDELDEMIGAWTREQDHVEAMHLLQAAGVTAAAVLNSKQVLLDPHLRERGYFTNVEHAGSSCPVPKALGARFSGFGTAARGPGPKLGEHNREVLQGLLGLSDDELTELREAGAVGDSPDFSPIPLDAMRAFVQWPLASIQQLGAITAIEPDFRRQLGLERPSPETTSE